jgi:hypothetical protein
MRIATIFLWLFTGVCFATAVLALGANPNGTVWLSWNPDWAGETATDLTIMPTSARFLYIQLGNINELAGCEFLLLWEPDGRERSGCYEFLIGAHQSGTYDDCTWMMRGSQIEGINEYSAYKWIVAFAGNQCNNGCASGNVAKALFEFQFCEGDVPGIFCILYAKVADCSAKLNMITVVGDPSVLGGGGVPYPCGLIRIDARTTWGSIKAIYR